MYKKVQESIKVMNILEPAIQQEPHEKYAELESGKHGFAYASGMSAADAILSLLKVGDEVIAIDDLYGGTRRLFEKVVAVKSGLSFKFLDYQDFSHINKFVTNNTKMIWVESPTNPLLKLVSFKELSSIDKRIITVVDNTFASPMVQRPLEYEIMPPKPFI